MPLKVAKLLLEINCLAEISRLLDIFTDIPHERDKLCGVLITEQNPLYCLIKL